MNLTLKPATADYAPAIAGLRAAVAENLAAHHGQGPWSAAGTVKGVLFDLRNASVLVATRHKQVIATLSLGTKKPWALDRKYFSPCKHPLYLTSMAVHPDWQRQGIGRLCLAEAIKLVKQWPGDAIFLDAYGAAAGASEFYRKCGFREVGRATYRNAPLIYFELLL